METFFIVDNPRAQIQSYCNTATPLPRRETVKLETALVPFQAARFRVLGCG